MARVVNSRMLAINHPGLAHLPNNLRYAIDLLAEKQAMKRIVETPAKPALDARSPQKSRPDDTPLADLVRSALHMADLHTDGPAAESRKQRISARRSRFVNGRHEVNQSVSVSPRMKERVKTWRRTVLMGGLPRGSCVYVIEGLPGVFKIGRTKWIKSRIGDLQIGSPSPLRLVAMVCTPYWRSSDELEATLHAYYEESRMHGEWFNLDKREMIELYKATKEWIVKVTEPTFQEARS